VRDLVRVTGKQKRAEHFAETPVTADDLERLGTFLIAIANFKKSHADKPARIAALRDNGAASIGQPDVRTEHAALEACADTVA
jgi:hypothetical protein